MYIILTGLWLDVPYEVKKGIGVPPRVSTKDVNFASANDACFGPRKICLVHFKSTRSRISDQQPIDTKE